MCGFWFIVINAFAAAMHEPIESFPDGENRQKALQVGYGEAVGLLSGRKNEQIHRALALATPHTGIVGPIEVDSGGK